MNCPECRGQCCLFFGLPSYVTKSRLRTVGIPLAAMRMSEEYVRLHIGLTVVGGRILVDEDTEIVVHEGQRGVRLVLAIAPCLWLHNGRCAHYEARPQFCRAFTKQTAWRFLVPAGCKLDPGGLGEDVTEIVKKAREVLKRERVLGGVT